MPSADRLPRVWVKPVNPEEYPGVAERRAKPVTRADLDHQLQTTALRGFDADRSPDQPPHQYRVVNIKETLDLYTKDYDFGRVVWPFWTFLFAENWRDAIDEMAARKLYLFDIWGYCPSGPDNRFGWSEYQIPDDKHRYILEKMGPLFLGYSYFRARRRHDRWINARRDPDSSGFRSAPIDRGANTARR